MGMQLHSQGPAHVILKKNVWYATSKILYDVLPHFFVIHSFFTLLITLSTSALIKFSKRN